METGENIQDMGENLTPPVNDPEQIVDAGQPEKPPEEGKPKKPELSETEKALIKARDENARKAREAEDKFLRLQEQVLAQRPVEREEEIDPDMPMTVGDYNKLEEKRVANERKRQQETQVKQAEDRVKQSVAKVRSKYSDSEYNYDWALEYAQTHFSQEDLNAIALMSNPAQKLYDFVMLQDENRDKVNRSEIVKETVDTISKNLNSPGTLSETGGANKVMDELKQFDKLSGREYVEKMDAIIASKA